MSAGGRSIGGNTALGEARPTVILGEILGDDGWDFEGDDGWDFGSLCEDL
jgi:hypothetical protein